MNDRETAGIESIELIDIDGSNIGMGETTSWLNKNGFLLCKRGSISLMFEERIFDVREGDLFIYPAFTQTRILGFSDDLQGVAGAADFDFVLFSLDLISDSRSQIYIRFHPYVSLTAGQYSRIEEIIGVIRNRKETNTVLKAHVISALVRAFCCEVIDAYITNKPIHSVKQTRKDKVFQNFLAALYRNFHVHRSVRFYAGQQNLTPRYFATLIRDVSGKTPLQWISMFVIIEAKRLLSKPENNVKAVSNILNFTEQTIFGRYFRQYAGCSPSEYKSRFSAGK